MDTNFVDDLGPSEVHLRFNTPRRDIVRSGFHQTVVDFLFLVWFGLLYFGLIWFSMVWLGSYILLLLSCSF